MASLVQKRLVQLASGYKVSAVLLAVMPHQHAEQEYELHLARGEPTVSVP